MSRVNFQNKKATRVSGLKNCYEKETRLSSGINIGKINNMFLPKLLYNPQYPKQGGVLVNVTTLIPASEPSLKYKVSLL